MNFRYPLCIGLLFACLITCAARRRAITAPDLIRHAESIGVQDRAAAVGVLEDYLEGRTDAAVEPWAMVWAGEQRRLGGELSTARAWFVKVTRQYPMHTLNDAAVLGINLIDGEAALTGNALATLQLLSTSNVPDTMNADRFRILARVAADDGAPRMKVRDLARKAIAYASADPTVLQRVRTSLYDILQAPTEPEMPGAMGIDGADIALKRARAALVDGDYAETIRLAKGIRDAFPASAHDREIGYLLQRAEKGDPTVAGRIGVLLPLTGDYALPAARLQKVIELAIDQIEPKAELSFADTQGDPATAVAAVERLVMEEGCVAVLGPLLKNTSLAAAEAAQALRTPMVALTQSGSPTDIGEFIFRGFLPLRQQIEALVDHAMAVAGHQRFAIVYPRNTYGDFSRDLFAAGVEARGGRIVQLIPYDTDTRDFRDAAKTLGQGNASDRSVELLELQAAAARRGDDPNLVELPPSLDYDAIFIPDSHRRLVLLASALAYEEIPIGRFRRRATDRPIQLLGLNVWNDPALAKTGGRYVYDSVFVDAFWSGSAEPATQAFVTLYSDAFSRTPGVVDALMWDSARLVVSAVHAGGADRQAVRNDLSTARLMGPVAGGDHFGPRREIPRDLVVLTVNQKGIRPWTSPDAIPPEGIAPNHE